MMPTGMALTTNTRLASHHKLVIYPAMSEPYNADLLAVDLSSVDERIATLRRYL